MRTSTPSPKTYPCPWPTLQPSPTTFNVTLEAPGILHVALCRPKQLNAWAHTSTMEMRKIFDTLAVDPLVDVVILSGEGRAFCAGLDVGSSQLTDLAVGGGGKDSDSDQDQDVDDHDTTIEEEEESTSSSSSSSSPDPARIAFGMKRHIDEFQASLTSMETCMKPVISAVHGIVFGLGVDLMCATDIRYADEASRFCIKEVDIGLCADIGSLQRFPKIVGNDSVARELAMTAREFDSAEALRIGFLGKVTKGGRQGAIDAALATASLMVTKSPVALRSTKQILLHARDHSVPEGLDYVSVWNQAMLQSRDIPRAMAGALSKQKVRFSRL